MDDDGVADLGAPNCAVELLPMESTGDVPYWRCPSCGLVALS